MRALLDAWLTECDRSAPVDEESKYNEMHVVGLGLCALLQRCELGGYAGFSLAAALGAHAARVVLHAEAVSAMTWLQLSETLTALQLEFKASFAWDREDGYSTSVDYATLMLVVLKRVGFWLGRQWRRAELDAGGGEDAEALQGLVDLDRENWRCVRPACAVQVLDGVHAVLSLARLLLTARVVALHSPDADAVRDEVRLYNHHREASIDDFYEMSMVADCMVGSVAQYKHKFQFCSTPSRRSCTTTFRATSASGSSPWRFSRATAFRARTCCRCCCSSTPTFRFSTSTRARASARRIPRTPSRGSLCRATFCSSVGRAPSFARRISAHCCCSPPTARATAARYKGHRTTRAMPDTRTLTELAEVHQIHDRYERDYRAYVLKLALSRPEHGTGPVWR